jgi:hypothetical protein
MNKSATLGVPFMSPIFEQVLAIFATIRSPGTIASSPACVQRSTSQDCRYYRPVFARRPWLALGSSTRVYRSDECAYPLSRRLTGSHRLQHVQASVFRSGIAPSPAFKQWQVAINYDQNLYIYIDVANKEV